MTHMRKKLVTVLAILGLLASTAVFAAGSGGGGGGGGPCFEDSWSCTDFGMCQANGTQSRTCSLTQDCPFAETPSPATSQKCTPKCTQDTWTCGDWGQCSVSGSQTRSCSKTTECDLIETPSPATSQSCAAPAPLEEPAPAPTPTPTAAPTPSPAPKTGCSIDTWRCGDWAVCDTFGNQARVCTKTTDCAGVDTPQPQASRRCEKLQCGDKTDLRERVACRLKLAPSGIARELEIEYLPEECRAIPTGSSDRGLCIARYKSLAPCWAKAVGLDRDICAKEVLKFDAAATPEAKRQATYGMIKFRFYDLSERAEDLIEDGVSADDVATFVATVESKKQEFNAARTKDQRRQIILDVRAAWKAFVAKAKLQLKK